MTTTGDTAEKKPLKIAATEKKASDRRKVMPSKNSDPHRSQAGLDVLPEDTSVILSLDAAEISDKDSEDNQFSSIFRRGQNAFSMITAAENKD